MFSSFFKIFNFTFILHTSFTQTQNTENSLHILSQQELTSQPHQAKLVTMSLNGPQNKDSDTEVGVTPVNSSRWTKEETLVLLGLWEHSYMSRKGKIRTRSYEWKKIGEKFNHRIADAHGPRTTNQCNTSIKTLLEEFKRSKDERSFPYHQIMKEIEAKFSDVAVTPRNLCLESPRTTYLKASQTQTLKVPLDIYNSVHGHFSRYI